jgi:endonuclease G
MGNELFIITGSYGEGGVGNNGAATSIDLGRVVVPAFVWKVIVVIPNGNGDLARVSAASRVIAVVAPNTNTVNSNWKTYRTSVDVIEAATGYNLLSNLPDAVQQIVEAQIDNL